MKNLLFTLFFSLIFSFFYSSASASEKEITITPKIRFQYEAKALRIIYSEEGRKQFRSSGVEDPGNIKPGQHLLISTSEVTVDHIVKDKEKSVNILILALYAQDQNKVEKKANPAKEKIEMTTIASGAANSQSVTPYKYGVGLAMAYRTIGSKELGYVPVAPVPDFYSTKKGMCLGCINLIVVVLVFVQLARKQIRANKKEEEKTSQQQEIDFQKKLAYIRNRNTNNMNVSYSFVSTYARNISVAIIFVLFSFANKAFAKGGGKHADFSSIEVNLESWQIAAIACGALVGVIIAIWVAHKANPEERSQDNKNEKSNNAETKMSSA